MFKLKILFSRIMSIEPIRRQSIVSLVWQIAFTFIGFLSTMYFAQTVGAGVLGAYFLFMAYYSIIGLMADGGFGGAAIKRISEGEESDAYFSAFVVLRSAFVTTVVVILFAFRSYFVDLNNEGIFIWLLLALIVGLFGGAVSSGIAGCGKMGIAATGGFINNVSRILIQVIAVFLGYGAAGLAGGFVLGMLVGSIIQLRFFELHFVKFGAMHLKSLSSFSFWVFLINGGSLVFANSDVLMIGYFLNNSDVGVYRVIFQFTSLAAFTTIALRATLYPKVSRWDKIGEKGQIETSLSKAFTYSLLLSIPMLVGGILLGDKLLYFFYGSKFVSHETLVILFLLQSVNIFQYFFTTYLIAMDQLKKLFNITLISVTANIVLNGILIPLIGISGAAIATLTTMAMSAVFAGRVLSAMITVRVETASVVNIFKASAVMGIIVGVYRMFVPLTSVWLTLVPVVLGTVVYVILVLRFDRKIYEELKEIV